MNAPFIVKYPCLIGINIKYLLFILLLFYSAYNYLLPFSFINRNFIIYRNRWVIFWLNLNLRYLNLWWLYLHFSRRHSWRLLLSFVTVKQFIDNALIFCYSVFIISWNNSIFGISLRFHLRFNLWFLFYENRLIFSNIV